MKKVSDTIRALVLVAIIIVAVAYGMVELMKIQVVDGDKYELLAKETKLNKQIVEAPRGEIVDSNGVSLVKNRVGFNVIVDKAFFPDDENKRNNIILNVAKVLQDDNVQWIDNLPVTMTKPYTFTENSDTDIDKLKKNANVQVYATADECMLALVDKYNIADTYTDSEKRIIAGIRYEMQLKDFSVSNRYIFAEDIPMDTVVRIKEQCSRLDGIDVAESPIREYGDGDVIPHLIGTVGPINAEEYEKLNRKGYKLNDRLGKSGIEKAMEEYLRGQDGERTLGFVNGVVSSDEITKEPVPGNTIQLTVDAEYQKNIQNILENHIYWLQNQKSPDAKGTGANAGAVVVVDVKTGGILAAATYPTYNLNDYINNYSEVLNGENSPLTNRAISGLYRPGSTFKTVTATAALNEGLIDRNTTVTCNGIYTYWEDFQPKCTGNHGTINVVTAIEKSCNIFFYDVGRRMGIDSIEKYAHAYGLGMSTGFETGGAVGWIACPETFEERRLDWQAGNVVQAAIGQSETYVTPLQMACQAMTIANRGKRYKPHIVENIYDYNMNELISHKQTETAYIIEDKTGSTFDLVIQGMVKAGEFAPYYYPAQKDYYTDYVLTDLPEKVAIKTGTPQMTSKDDTGSAFIGFYPADNPEIAFSGFIEHGEYSKLMIRQIIEAYYNNNYSVSEPISQSDKQVENADLQTETGNNANNITAAPQQETTLPSVSELTETTVVISPQDDE